MVQLIMHNYFVECFPGDAAGRVSEREACGNSLGRLALNAGREGHLESVLSRTVTGCIYVFRRCISQSQLLLLV